jgi:hypothetical protein
MCKDKNVLIKVLKSFYVPDRKQILCTPYKGLYEYTIWMGGGERVYVMLLYLYDHLICVHCAVHTV